MERHAELLGKIIGKNYVKQGVQNENSRHSLIQQLINHKKLPKEGWDEKLIEYIISEFSFMDSNNFLSNAGVGEREGRIFSQLVINRNFSFAHGIGRSGYISEVQPKAAGSSIIYKLANSLVANALQVAGLKAENCLLLPVATGMSLSLTMMYMKHLAVESKFVIWSRIDQKSCFKSIITAGLRPLVVDCIPNDKGELVTDLTKIRSLLELHKSEVLCVLSTSSCFAPRQPDLIDEIALLCKEHNVGHVINNAYGVQCEYICRLINRAMSIGRVDAVVQSMDKNFMVPVGGAIVFSPSESFITQLSSFYPGRASIAPILDLFITLLSMGENGYRNLLEERKRLFNVLKERVNNLLIPHNMQMLSSPNNSISIGISLEVINKSDSTKSLTSLGSMLFHRNVSGCRVVDINNKVTSIMDFEFTNWGSHTNNYNVSYFTIACAIGMKESEIQTFVDRLKKLLKKF